MGRKVLGKVMARSTERGENEPLHTGKIARKDIGNSHLKEKEFFQKEEI